MAVVIPNTGDTTGGNAFAALSQAAPDSVDFEILGNTGRSGVLTGCAVSANGNSSNVSVGAGAIVLNGASYAVGANSVLSLPTSPVNTRFDLVVARVSGSSATLVTVAGNDSTDAPTFPKSAAVVGGTFDPATQIDLNTDVVLAAVLRVGSSPVTGAHVADRRTMVTSSIPNRGTNVSSLGAATGDLFYKSDADGTSSSSSGVYVRNSSGDAVELASNYRPSIGVPVGGTIMWHTTTLPEGYLWASGGSFSKASYPALYAALGSGAVYGQTSTHFNVPNLNDRLPRGVSGTPGGTGGAASVTLTTSNMPQHSHGMPHTHSNAHVHGMTHGHPDAFTDDDNHVHNFGKALHGFAPATNEGVQRLTVQVNGVDAVQGGAMMSDTHNHVSPTPNFVGNTLGSSSSTTSSPSEANTSNAGSGTSFSNLPPYLNVKFIIRAV